MEIRKSRWKTAVGGKGITRGAERGRSATGPEWWVRDGRNPGKLAEEDIA